MDKFIAEKNNYIAFDKEQRPVFLAESAWLLQMAQEKYPDIEFFFKSEF
jgi:peptide chain release factor 3